MLPAAGTGHPEPAAIVSRFQGLDLLHPPAAVQPANVHQSRQPYAADVASMLPSPQSSQPSIARNGFPVKQQPPSVPGHSLRASYGPSNSAVSGAGLPASGGTYTSVSDAATPLPHHQGSTSSERAPSESRPSSATAERHLDLLPAPEERQSSAARPPADSRTAPASAPLEIRTAPARGTQSFDAGSAQAPYARSVATSAALPPAPVTVGAGIVSKHQDQPLSEERPPVLHTAGPAAPSGGRSLAPSPRSFQADLAPAIKGLPGQGSAAAYSLPAAVPGTGSRPTSAASSVSAAVPSPSLAPPAPQSSHRPASQAANLSPPAHEPLPGLVTPPASKWPALVVERGLEPLPDRMARTGPAAPGGPAIPKAELPRPPGGPGPGRRAVSPPVHPVVPPGEDHFPWSHQNRWLASHCVALLALEDGARSFSSSSLSFVKAAAGSCSLPPRRGPVDRFTVMIPIISSSAAMCVFPHMRVCPPGVGGEMCEAELPRSLQGFGVPVVHEFLKSSGRFHSVASRNAYIWHPECLGTLWGLHCG